MSYCHVTSGVLIRFQISRLIGVPEATALTLTVKTKDSGLVLPLFINKFP